MCQQKLSDGASLREEKACPDCPMTKNRLETGLERLVELSTISYGCTTGRHDRPVRLQRLAIFLMCLVFRDRLVQGASTGATL
jgi:hypothetical protein